MSLQASTGVRAGMLSSLKTSLDTGSIMIFAGTKPATADSAIGAAILLCTISAGGNGLTFDTGPVNGVLSKNPSETWAGVNVASGIASFYRHVGPGDDAVSSSTEPRLQGVVGTSGADLNLTAGTTLTSGVSTPVDTYSVELPSGG